MGGRLDHQAFCGMQKITTGALGFELAAVSVLGSTAVAYDYLSSQDSYY